MERGHLFSQGLSNRRGLDLVMVFTVLFLDLGGFSFASNFSLSGITTTFFVLTTTQDYKTKLSTVINVKLKVLYNVRASCFLPFVKTFKFYTVISKVFTGGNGL